MSYFRSYFEKNNTLIKDSFVNTSKNPTSDLYYGSTYSRFIFKLDLLELKRRVTDGTYIITSETKHYLHLTNTIFGDNRLIAQDKSNGKVRATSFTMELYKITESWNEGFGFDYIDAGFDFNTGSKTYSETASNWFKRNSLDTWTNEGSYNTGNTITTIEFDNGNEDIHVNITSYVNNILTGGTNNGLGLRFTDGYEDLSGATDKSVSFFTKYTQTFFEPYLESTFNDRIFDNRNNFIKGPNQSLFLYVTKGTNFYDLDSLPTVDILDNDGNIMTSLDDLTVTKLRKGVYYVTFQLSESDTTGKMFLYDKWKNLFIDGTEIDDVTQKFIPKSFTSNYTIGLNQSEIKRYSVQYFGIQQSEKVNRGEIRKIVINFRNINESKSVLFEEVYYRIFIKEGKTDVTVFDWTLLDTTNENSFMLDTSYLIPREYFMEIKGKKHNEIIFYKNQIKFEIVSEK